MLNDIQKKIIKKIIANKRRAKKAKRIDEYYRKKGEREMRYVRRLVRRIKRLSNNYD